MAEYAYQKHTLKIWNGSGWDSYTPMIWNGSAWVEHPANIYSEVTDTYLYNEGDLCSDITGGWSNSSTHKDGYLQVGGGDSGTRSITLNTVPTGQYSTISFEYIITNVHGSGNGNIWLRLNSSDSAEYPWPVATKSVATNGLTTTTKAIATLDISGINPDYYIEVNGWYATANIYRIWLE